MFFFVWISLNANECYSTKSFVTRNRPVVTSTNESTIGRNMGFSINIVNQYGSKLSHDPRINLKMNHWIQQRNVNQKTFFENVFYGDIYLAAITVGVPPFSYMVIIDTGSSLFWVQDVTCKSCLNYDIPGYNSKESSSLSKIKCNRVFGCPEREFLTDCLRNECAYEISYLNNKSSKGYLRRETLEFITTEREIMSIKDLEMGFGIETTVRNKEAVGFLGLSRHEGSLIQQLNVGRFSFCLPGRASDQPGVLKFGPDADTIGIGIPMINHQELLRDHPNLSNLYSLWLQGFSVGGQKIQGMEGMVVTFDTGSTLTWVPHRFFGVILDKINRHISLQVMHGAYCHIINNPNDPILGPWIKWEFEKGFELITHLNSMFIFFLLNFTEAYCLNMLNYSSDTIIFGNSFMNNINFGIDEDEMFIHPQSC
ncbi:Eukaryotic aspartyl protease family protein [Rhynchospora pubera]|uniref:Eukaryotic aspartyl protease family protein n=1 Tax=Rhynchospora pubera TaxID=906938 RepID=A0AAV8G3D4_9POAL|nr:Eukaryotic aspartyl protease family protein [Rhynchospora pubera]